MSETKAQLPSRSSFSELLCRLRKGDQEAAWQVITTFADEMRRVVRRRLPRDLRPKFDSEDFVQAAWASVFANRSRLAQLESPNAFLAYMARVTSNKVAMEIRRRMLTTKFNVNLECSLGADSGFSQAKRNDLDTPSQIAVARERWQAMLEGVSPKKRRMIQLRFEGVSYQEIADRLGVDERTVRRTMKRALGE